MLSVDNTVLWYIKSLNQNRQRLIFRRILGDFADVKQPGRDVNIISEEKMKVSHSILICTST